MTVMTKYDFLKQIIYENCLKYNLDFKLNTQMGALTEVDPLLTLGNIQSLLNYKSFGRRLTKAHADFINFLSNLLQRCNITKSVLKILNLPVFINLFDTKDIISQLLDYLVEERTNYIYIIFQSYPELYSWLNNYKFPINFVPFNTKKNRTNGLPSTYHLYNLLTDCNFDLSGLFPHYGIITEVPSLQILLFILENNFSGLVSLDTYNNFLFEGELTFENLLYNLNIIATKSIWDIYHQYNG
jgi:hypothetical protein